MSWPLLAHCVNKLMLRLLQMQIAVLCAFQAIGGLEQPLEQPLERGTVSGIPLSAATRLGIELRSFNLMRCQP
jgi:hypothetical protein